MSIVGLIVAVIIAGIALLFILTPLFNRTDRLAADDRQRDRLLVTYERILTNLRDLDEDYSTGKMPPMDYQTEREMWVRRGIQALKALDSIDRHEMVAASDFDSEFDRQIEAYPAKVEL
jgi:type II secretory pathway pseudopilin PulG